MRNRYGNRSRGIIDSTILGVEKKKYIKNTFKKGCRLLADIFLLCNISVA